MSERAPYSRVYWAIVDDAKFSTVYDDDRHLAAWLRLLLIADQSWPASAHIPSGCRKASIDELERVGLIDRSGSRYRVRGLDKERETRSADASKAARKRWGSADATAMRPHSERNADGMLDETRRDEDETSRAETPRDAADIYWQLTGKFPAGRALDWIDNLASTYGADQTIRALVQAQTADKSVSDLLSRTQDILRAHARKLDLREREDEQRRLAEKRSVPRVEEPWRAEFREAIRKQYEGLDAA